MKKSRTFIKKNRVKIISFLITLALVFTYFYINFVSNASIVDKAKGTYRKESNDQDLKKIVEVILGYIQTVGIAVFLGSIMVFGIRWVSADSAKQAEIKEKAMLWIIAGVLIFSSTKIVEIIIKAGDQILPN